LRIDTPENVAFDYEVAGIGSRFLAAVVDTLLILVLQVVIVFVTILVVSLFFSQALERGRGLLGWLIGALSLLAFAFFWGYYVFFEAIWNGQSPGKRWVGLRVIRTDGTPLSLPESIIRNLVRLVDFLPAYYGVGVVAMFVNSQARRLGDLAAGTLVVHDRATVTLESLAVRPAVRPASPQQPAFSAEGLPLERLTSQDLQMAEEFLRRREQLANRRDVARQVALALFKRMEVPVGQLGGWAAERWIEAVVEAGRKPG
jgi:uncharacterized RDD family membrane protein YckC